MIKINNVKLAENEEEFINSLFEKDGTCSGYAKKLKRQIKIEDHNHKIVGVVNKYGCLCKATKLDTGGYWYSYGDIDLIGNLTCSNWDNDLQELKAKSSYNNTDKEYWFK